MTGDEKSKVGSAEPEDESIYWDYFEKKDYSFNLKEPLRFKIDSGRFSGKAGDFQFNSCGFLLFSYKLRTIIEKYLTEIDNPKWFQAVLTDLEGNTLNYSILYFFNKPDFLDYQNSTFMRGKRIQSNVIKKRYDLKKIGERLIYNSDILGVSLCVHDIVRKEIIESRCTGQYFYKIHTPGRLSW